MALTQLLLIRHGQNDWVGKRLPGQTAGIHLSAEGRQQAVNLADRLAEHGVDAVYASTLERAQETAAPIASAVGSTVQDVPELVDLDTGAWTGMEIKVAAEKPEWRGIQAFPSLTRIPEGESIWEMQVRAVAAVDRIRQRHDGQCVAIVAHADVIKSLVAHYVGLHLDLFQRLEIATASVSVLWFGDFGPRLVALNSLGPIPKPPGESTDRKAG